MANKEIGEVSFKVGKKSYTLRYGTNALCELEDLLGRPLQAAASEMSGEDIKLSTVRAVLWAGLLENHEGIQLTQAGQILDGLGLAAATEKIGEAIALAFPEEESGNRKAATRKK